MFIFIKRKKEKIMNLKQIQKVLYQKLKINIWSYKTKKKTTIEAVGGQKRWICKKEVKIILIKVLKAIKKIK